MVEDAEGRSEEGPADRPASPEEAALIARLLARDEAAFAELIDRYHGPLLRLARAFVPTRAIAEEVVQETWLGVLDGLPRFEGRSSLKTWIFRILSNRARTRGVREGRSVPFSSLVSEEETGGPAVDPARFQTNGMWASPPRPWSEDTPEKLLMNRHAVQQLEVAIASLPQGQRAVVTLRDVEGLDSEEVCNVLGITATNQRVLLHRARAKLRAVLEEIVDRG